MILGYDQEEAPPHRYDRASRPGQRAGHHGSATPDAPAACGSHGYAEGSHEVQTTPEEGPMKPIHWYVGLALLVATLIVHALFPRYEWRVAGDSTGIQQLLRLDNWTGEAVVVTPRAER